jgi:multiple antibiotic resistance protein
MLVAHRARQDIKPGQSQGRARTVNELINAFLLIYVGLFPVVNPVGCAPMFLSLTHRCSNGERNVLARRVAWNGFFLLLGSLLAGSYILEFFGITLPAVRIAGGLVVTAFGWKMLHASNDPEGQSGSTQNPEAPVNAFYPLTMPITVGPGSISVAITFGSQRPPLEAGLAHYILVGAAAIAGLAAIATTVYVCYRSAARIVAALGKHGTDVLTRLSAFILLCIGVQIVWNGYSALIVAGR